MAQKKNKKNYGNSVRDASIWKQTIKNKKS